MELKGSNNGATQAKAKGIISFILKLAAVLGVVYLLRFFSLEETTSSDFLLLWLVCCILFYDYVKWITISILLSALIVLIFNLINGALIQSDDFLLILFVLMMRLYGRHSLSKSTLS